MRVAFSIILNGLHHLKHNNYYKTMMKNFDYWLIAEGASENGGSTRWCKSNKMVGYCTPTGNSIDGTKEFLESIQSDKIKVIFANRKWVSKDEQVNATLSLLPEIKFPCFLWQIDIDEQWDKKSLREAEKELISYNGKVGCFISNFWVGEKLQVRGEWGEGKDGGYKRLWLWNGEKFDTHEPPKIVNESNSVVLLSQRFNHYAYYFKKDVEFKNNWYGGHEGILDMWTELQKETSWPQPIKRLIIGSWVGTNTMITKI